jgi:uracil-DNA glycosylase
MALGVSWAGVGRLLAKCVMDGVSVTGQWHPLVFEHVLTGRSATALESALDALETWAPDLHRDATRVLQSRLDAGSAEIVCGRHPGLAANQAKVPVTDATKRATVLQWARHALVRRVPACYFGCNPSWLCVGARLGPTN